MSAEVTMTSKLDKGFLDGVVGVVEANSFESMKLYGEYSSEWVGATSGYMVQVGETAGMPVCIAVNCSVVKGRKILFFEATSKVVDYRLIDLWLEENMPKSAFNGERLNRSNAMNFHNVLTR